MSASVPALPASVVVAAMARHLRTTTTIVAVRLAATAPVVTTTVVVAHLHVLAAAAAATTTIPAKTATVHRVVAHRWMNTLHPRAAATPMTATAPHHHRPAAGTESQSRT